MTLMHSSKRAALIGLSALTTGVVSVPFASTVSADSSVVTVNFSSSVDQPLIKSKFGVYDTPYVSIQRQLNTMALTKALRPAQFRIETAWGKESDGGHAFKTLVNGTSVGNTADLDSLVGSLNQAQIPTTFIDSYTPSALIPAGGDWRSPPTNLTTWGNLGKSFAEHFESQGFKVNSEIWNEPDLFGVFWSGTENQYIDLYRNAAPLVKSGNPDAMVGGPAYALTGWGSDTNTPDTFLDMVQNENLPIDFYSFHWYGNPNDGIFNTTRDASGRGYGTSDFVKFATMDYDLTEYNYLNDFGSNSEVIHYPAAAHLLDSFNEFLKKPWLNHVEWAQLHDPICDGVSVCSYIGLIDKDGHKRAAYNAFYLYQNMPVDRKAVSVSGGLRGMASSDPHRSGVLLWNLSGSDQTASVQLNNVPFATGDFSVYRIDATHGSYVDTPSSENLTPAEPVAHNVSTSNYNWNGVIPNNGVVYLEFKDASGITGLEPSAMGNVIRTINYHPNPSGASYSSADPVLRTFYAGMGNSDYGDAEVGMVMDSLPATVNISAKIDGPLQTKDVNSAFGVRVDYQVGNSYTKGIIFHPSGLYNSARSAPVPFGTLRQADQDVTVADISNFTIDLNQYKPANWTGRATISLVMQNTGANTRASVQLRDGSAGLKGEYYSGMNFNTLMKTRTDADINFDWGVGSPDGSVPVDGFSARWTGAIQPKSSGLYTFYLNTDNGRRLWIDNQLVIDKWIDDWGTTYSGQIYLDASVRHSIKVEYFENFGGANAKLEWSSAAQPREVVPASQFYLNLS